MDADRIIDLISFNKAKPQVNQIETNLYCQRSEDKKWLAKLGIAHQAYAPLAQGRAKEMLSELLLQKIAKKHNKTPAQIALRFLVQQGTAVIPKSVHEERIKENISIFDFSLEDSELAELLKLDKAKPAIGNAENPDKVEFAMTW